MNNLNSIETLNNIRWRCFNALKEVWKNKYDVNTIRDIVHMCKEINKVVDIKVRLKDYTNSNILLDKHSVIFIYSICTALVEDNLTDKWYPTEHNLEVQKNILGQTAINANYIFDI